MLNLFTHQTKFLILGPSLHDRGVVDAVHEDLVDPLRLESVLLRKVSGDLLRGSGRRERAGQAHQNDLLPGDVPGDVHLRRREAEVDLDRLRADARLAVDVVIAGVAHRGHDGARRAGVRAVERAASKEETVHLNAPMMLTLEDAVEYIQEGEFVEVTPDAVRMGKKPKPSRF